MYLDHGRFREMVEYKNCVFFSISLAELTRELLEILIRGKLDKARLVSS